MKILVQPYSHILSHISRPLMVAKELAKRGHQVIFAGESPKTKFIQQEGFEVLPIYETDPDLLLNKIRKGNLHFVSDDEVGRMMESDLRLYGQVTPDLVLSDFRFTAPLSTQIAGLTHAAIVNVSSTEFRAEPYVPLFGWISSWLIGRNSSAWRHLNSLNLKMEIAIFDNFMSIFKRISKSHGLKQTITATNCLTGKDVTLIADIPEYFPSTNLPDSYHYVGPLTWKSNLPPPPWWPPKRNGKPLVYITMGTTGIHDFFYAVIELLRKADLSAVLSTGEQIQSPAMSDHHIYVEPYVDGDLVMEECDVVVCHGGNGTIYQALKHGKPIIGIPTVADQQFNMRRVEALGLGRTLTWKEFLMKPEKLTRLIARVQNERSFRANASRFKKILGTYNASETAADILIAMMR